MANTLTIDKISTLLKAVLKDATGQDTAALDTKQLLTLGQKALKTCADPVMNAISQMLSRTIFSSRPYKAKFEGMRIPGDQWGNWVRKIKTIDDPDELTDNPYCDLNDGQSVDQYTIRKPKVAQFNFYGQQSYEYEKTIFETQLNTAFNSAEDFGAFISMILTNMNNKIEKTHEETARATVAGFAAGKIAQKADVIHLLTEYNTVTGLELTATTVMQPANYKAFTQWAFSRLANLSDMLTEYSSLYQTNSVDGVFLQHSPKSAQRVYLNSMFMHQTNMMALADTFHDNFLRMAGDVEYVNYWQIMADPQKINVVKPQYLAADGTIATAEANVNQGNVLGIICDRDAFGYSPILTRQRVTPPNAKGEYYNIFWKYNERHAIDFTEKGVVILMD